MGKLTGIDISFNDKEFIPGSSVIGTIKLILNGTLKFYWVKAQMIGKCTTKWLKKSKGCFPGNDKFEGKEDYCNQEILLWGSESTAGYHSLNGVEEKQFAFDIPENCPSSFQSGIGKISYSIRVICKCPPAFFRPPKYIFSKSFRVVNPYDLSLDLRVYELCKPVYMRGEFNNTCCLCFNTSCDYDICTEKRAFVSGEHIVINGNITNNSSRVLPFVFSLTRKCSFLGHKKSNIFMSKSRSLEQISHEELICSWHSDPILPYSTYECNNMPSIKIPDKLEASNLTNCSIVHIKYEITVSGKLYGIFSSKTFTIGKFHVQIGTRILNSNRDLSTINENITLNTNEFHFAEVEPSAPPMEDYGFVNPQESCDFVLPKQNDEISNRPFLLQ